MKNFYVIILFFSVLLCQSQNVQLSAAKSADLLKIDSLTRLLANPYSCAIEYHNSKTIINTEGFVNFELSDTIKMKELSKTYLTTPYPTVKQLFELLTRHHYYGVSTYEYPPAIFIISEHKPKKGYLINLEGQQSTIGTNDNPLYNITIISTEGRITEINLK